MKLADATFALIDTEASGRVPELAEIAEVGVLLCDGALWPDASLKTFVYTSKPLSAEVRGVHRRSVA